MSSGVQQGVRNTRKNKMIITSRFGFVSGVPWWNTTIKWLSCFSIAYSNCGAIQCWSNIYLIHQKFTQRFSFGMKMHVCYVRLWIDCCYVLVWFFLWQLINHYVRYYISFMPAVSLTPNIIGYRGWYQPRIRGLISAQARVESGDKTLGTSLGRYLQRSSQHSAPCSTNAKCSKYFFKAGCVHFVNANECDVRILLLIFSPRKRAFVGLIPNDQVFILINSL